MAWLSSFALTCGSLHVITFPLVVRHTVEEGLNIPTITFAGEPILIPELQMAANVTPTDQVTRYCGILGFEEVPIFRAFRSPQWLTV